MLIEMAPNLEKLKLGQSGEYITALQPTTLDYLVSKCPNIRQLLICFDISASACSRLFDAISKLKGLTRVKLYLEEVQKQDFLKLTQCTELNEVFFEFDFSDNGYLDHSGEENTILVQDYFKQLLQEFKRACPKLEQFFWLNKEENWFKVGNNWCSIQKIIPPTLDTDELIF